MHEVDFANAPTNQDPPIFVTRILDKNKSKVIRFQSKNNQELFAKTLEIVKLHKNELTCLKYKLLSD